jgi:hypothetical protein
MGIIWTILIGDASLTRRGPHANLLKIFARRLDLVVRKLSKDVSG